MHFIKRALTGAVVLAVLFSLFAVVAGSQASADGWILGPVTYTGTATSGQTLTVQSNFSAPSTAGLSYVLDTEVYNASGTRVAQWFDSMVVAGGQKVTRSYSWNTTGLPNGTYTFQQGVFNANWAGSLAWNSNSGTINLGSNVSALPAATPTPTKTPTPAPTTAAVQANWQSSAKLQNATAVAGVSNAAIGTYYAATNGSYIINLELYNSSGVRVAQWFETRSMTVGQAQVLTAAWTPASAGSYKLKTGIFTTAWSNLNWNDNALSFSVGTGTTTTTATPTPTTVPVSNASFKRGVNLAGAEFGQNNIPGVYNTDYIYPNASELDYYKSKGLTLIRLPFLWERLQRSLNGSLDATELGRIDTFVAAVKARGMSVIIEPHNYARYTINGTANLIGSSQVPNAAFADFWSKLAGHFKSETAIYAFSLMNEPHDTNGLWKAAAQAGVNAIRQVDMSHTILIPGDAWSGAWTWQQNNANLIISDPANNLIYEAHQYFDRDGSGTYGESYDASGAYPTIGVDRIQPFINWLRANNLRGIVTEYGVPNNSDPRWLTVLDNFMAKLDAEGISGTYWAGGPWWGGYALSSEPKNGQDAPVMGILTKHLGK